MEGQNIDSILEIGDERGDIDLVNIGIFVGVGGSPALPSWAVGSITRSDKLTVKVGDITVVIARAESEGADLSSVFDLERNTDISGRAVPRELAANIDVDEGKIIPAIVKTDACSGFGLNPTLGVKNGEGP